MSKDLFNQGSGREYGSVRDGAGFSSTSRPTYMDSAYMNFDEMCEEISKNIYLINSGANKVEKSSQLIGSDKDSVKLRDKIHEASLTTTKIVEQTMSMLKKIAASRQMEKMKQVRVDRLTTQFQETVQRFTSLQKSAAEKVRMTGDVRERTRPHDGLLGDDYGDKTALVEQERRLQQLQEQEEAIDNDVELIREREDRIRQLESDILDVNTIFRDLGAMIHDQGATIDLIETNVETAYSHVETGTTQLNKASTYQKKARKKMCILLIILLIVAVIISIIIATQVNK